MKQGVKQAEYFLPGEFTDLNTYINKERTNRILAAMIKRDETLRVQYELLGRVNFIREYPVIIEFFWRCKNAKKDPDNIAFAKKFILDGMVKGMILQNDTWEFIRGFVDHFEVVKNDKDIGVIVVVKRALED